VENAATGTASYNLQSLNVGDISDALPIGARQPGTSTLIDDGDWRIQDAVWRSDKLYAVTEIRVGSGASAHDVVHWFVVDTSNLNTLILLSQGNIDYGSGIDTYYGNMTVDNAGNMIIGYSYSGPGDANHPAAYASSVYAVIPAGGTGLADGGVYLTQGQGTFVQLDSFGRDRWGDYSGVAIDPTDSNSFWVFNEHATNTNSWATTIGGMLLTTPVPEIVVSFSGTNIADGDTTPSSSEGTDFGSATLGGTAVQHTFTVTNTGAGTLTTSGLTLPSGFSLVEGYRRRSRPATQTPSRCNSTRRARASRAARSASPTTTATRTPITSRSAER
jgi:hypothetical protein